MKVDYWSRAVFPSEPTHALSMVRLCQHLEEAGQVVRLFGYAGAFADDSDYLHRYFGTPSVNFVLRQTPFVMRSPKVRSSRLGAILMGRWLRSQSLTGNPDVIYTRLTDFELLSLPGDVPLVFEMHKLGALATKNSRAAAIAQAFHRRRVLLVTTTEPLAAWLSTSFPHARVIVAPLSAPDVQGEDLDASARAATLPLDLLEGGANVGYTGYVDGSHLRGVWVIVELARLMPQLRFHVVGGPPEHAGELRRRARQEGISNLRVYGRQPPPSMAHFLRGFDVLLSPTQYVASPSAPHGQNASPLKISQYMSSGTPIVASDTPAHRERLESGYSAVLVQPDDISSWARAITQVLEDREGSRNIASNARQEYLGKLAPEIRASLLIAEIRGHLVK